MTPVMLTRSGVITTGGIRGVEGRSEHRREIARLRTHAREMNRRPAGRFPVKFARRVLNSGSPSTADSQDARRESGLHNYPDRSWFVGCIEKVFNDGYTADIQGDFVVFSIRMRINQLIAVRKWVPVARPAALL
jgi:hypothetical protein